MSDVEPSHWNLEKHLQKGTEAVASISAQSLNPEPVCHHFSEVDPVDPMEVSISETYTHLRSSFAELGLEFLADRLEAWETITPSIPWLQEYIPAILDLSAKADLIYEGWTWEPAGCQPIGAAMLDVINNRAQIE